jgi:drug/metabolite transporter (DMT)-like permease
LSTALATPSRTLPALALCLNALVWGTAWWPLRYFESLGLHPLWTTALVYAAVVLVIVLWRPRAVMQVLGAPALWWLVLAAGTTNATFNWAVVIGDVVRVILLFYLMPVWAVLLARLLLHEPITRAAALRVALGVAGAAVVLWPPGAGLEALPLPHSLADWLGVVGGFSFALNNVLLKREAQRPEEGRALAMFVGGALVSAVLALALRGSVPLPPAPALAWLVPVLVMAALFGVGNLALQFGAGRLPANVTSVVMLTEVVFATGSALALGSAQPTAQAVLGGGLILLAALLAAREPMH